MTSQTSGAIYTVGYEGIDADRLIELLRQHRIETLVDARWRPASRKRGLSKTPLSEACHRVGIEYAHRRDLGTPPEIMRKLREEGTYDWDAYQGFLGEQDEGLTAASAIASASRTCLLCFEADAGQCHRRLVAEEISKRTGLRVEHIPVTPA